MQGGRGSRVQQACGAQRPIGFGEAALQGPLASQDRITVGEGRLDTDRPGEGDDRPGRAIEIDQGAGEVLVELERCRVQADRVPQGGEPRAASPDSISAFARLNISRADPGWSRQLSL